MPGRTTQNNEYQPLPIYDWESGLNLTREPWLLPKDAFTDILNFHVRQGVLRKRLGYTKFCEMVHKYTQSIGTGDGSTKEFSGTASNTPIRKESDKTYFQIKDNDGQVAHDEDGDGILEGDVDSAGTNTVDYETGDVTVTFASAPPNSNDIQMIYNHLPGLPITGIYSYYSGTGDRQLMIFDTKRINVYNSTDGYTHDLTEVDEFTGDNADYIQFESWCGNSYITNNYDRIKKYDGTSVSNFDIDTDDDGSNDVSKALLLFAYKGHLVVLRPTEDGTEEPQRARWSAPGSDSDWHNGGYVDAPTLDWIITAGFLGDRLIVAFERSIWALNYVGDVDMPFQWEKLVSTEGSTAKMSMVPFANEIYFLGPVEFIVFDGVATDQLSKDVPEISLTFNQQKYSMVYGAMLEEEHEVFWNYPAFDADYPEHNLVFNYWQSNWSIFDIPVQAVGYYEETSSYTWDDIDTTWDETMYTWDSKSIQAGYPVTLGGMQNGVVVRINDGGNDMGSPINAYAQTKALNPWYESMLNARLGYVDIYFTKDAGNTITLNIYESASNSPYFTLTLTLDAPSRLRKGFNRIPVNGVAAGHRIEIKNDASDEAPEIHALVLWMKPAGRIIET